MANTFLSSRFFVIVSKKRDARRNDVRWSWKICSVQSQVVQSQIESRQFLTRMSAFMIFSSNLQITYVLDLLCAFSSSLTRESVIAISEWKLFWSSQFKFFFFEMVDLFFENLFKAPIQFMRIQFNFQFLSSEILKNLNSKFA